MKKEMLSLIAVERVKKGDMQVLKNEKWLKFLALTSEQNINLERVNSLEEMLCRSVVFSETL